MKKVLLCDDDEGIVDIVKIVLEDKGYEVISTTDSKSVLKRIQDEQPDIVLLDLWMPSLGGETIVSKLRQDNKTKNIPIIIFSASKNTEKVARVVKADGFLLKPFDIVDLEKTIEKHL